MQSNRDKTAAQRSTIPSTKPYRTHKNTCITITLLFDILLLFLRPDIAVVMLLTNCIFFFTISRYKNFWAQFIFIFFFIQIILWATKRKKAAHSLRRRNVGVHDTRCTQGMCVCVCDGIYWWCGGSLWANTRNVTCIYNLFVEDMGG